MSDDLNEVVEQAKLGTQEGISKLIDSFESDLLRFTILLTKDPVWAQDLCQDTFVRIIERVHQLKETRKFRGWAFKIAKNLFYDEVKRKSYRLEVKMESLTEVASVSLLDSEEAIVFIAQILNELSLDDQMIILLSDLEKHEISEVCEIMDRSESAVRSQLSRAREHFMSRYHDNRPNDTHPFVCITEAIKHKI